MDTLLYYLARGIVRLLQGLPLTWMARIGQACGWIAFYLDRSHRRVVLDNLTRVFSKEMSVKEIRNLAHLNFIRIGENYACAIKTSAMSRHELEQCLEWEGLERLRQNPRSSKVVATGHFGNFELWVHITKWLEDLRGVATYRGLKHSVFTRLMQTLREHSGCLFFERRRDAAALKRELNRPGFIMGLLVDQHGGKGGIWGDFLGHPCSTNPSTIVLAQRYQAELYPGVCYRVGLAKWRIEIGESIPFSVQEQNRSVEDISGELNRYFEQAVLRDPSNWFWVHHRWKPFKPYYRSKRKGLE